jgi:hypothetical protein
VFEIKKATQAGAPQGEKAKLTARKTLRFIELLIVRLEAHKNERGRK